MKCFLNQFGGMNTSKNKSLFFKNWLNCGFTHVKDLFDDNVNFITEEILQEKLNNKHNWISGKNVVYKNIRKHFDTLICLYIQHSCIRNISFYTANSRIDPKQLAAKDCYKILVDKKEKKHTHKICGKKSDLYL